MAFVKIRLIDGHADTAWFEKSMTRKTTETNANILGSNTDLKQAELYKTIYK